MSKTAPKCPTCKGVGCVKCEGTGIKLYSEKEEEFDEYAEMAGDKLHEGDSNYIDFEEEDYQP